MKDYQKARVLHAARPDQDPLGRGFHIIQSTIAVGSGGFLGKGWLKGTQAHLEFIPERSTDFIFAVFSEEFGLVGNVVLLVLYLGSSPAGSSSPPARRRSSRACSPARSRSSSSPTRSSTWAW